MRCLVAILAICLFALSNVQTKPNGFDSKHLEIKANHKEAQGQPHGLER